MMSRDENDGASKKENILPKPLRITPGPGQESVWDYPRPPRWEPTEKQVQVIFNGIQIVETRRAIRVLETSHPPVYYIPPEDIQMAYLEPGAGSSYCEWKGQAAYYDVVVGERRARQAAWTYRQPASPYQAIANYVAFYAGPMDRCLVDGEEVQPQPGGFYGGWITTDIVGPFKGQPGTMGW
jgi:uncharacterized protein (DUF427 family)